eukprot:TRINITY_DN4913_c0_g1_i4.p1 TRINITY_DN4913_c0_g1~~TRINITY_DN4913_c0_g1_i4.p1  ORF type:complete len:456 (-),score=60.59 TRINITY_DN4913_c0_g1_i4:92-1429(-)
MQRRSGRLNSQLVTQCARWPTMVHAHRVRHACLAVVIALVSGILCAVAQSPGRMGPPGPPGEPGPPGPRGPRGASTNEELLKELSASDIEIAKIPARIGDQFKYDSLSGLARDAAKRGRQAKAFATDAEGRLVTAGTNLEKHVGLVTDMNDLAVVRMERELPVRQLLIEVGSAKAKTVPCGRCKWPDRTFQIVSSHGAALEFKGNQNKVGMATSDQNSGSQQWTYNPSTLNIKSSDGSCLDFYHETYDGGEVGTWPCNGKDNQRFAFSSLTGHLKTLNGKCLDFDAGGGVVRTWECLAGLSNQQWSFSEFQPGKKPIMCPDTCTWSEQLLHVISLGDGSALQAIPDQSVSFSTANSTADEQLWTWNPDSLQLRLGLDESSCLAAGAQLSLAGCNPTAEEALSQTFTYLPDKKIIMNMYSSLCLDSRSLKLSECADENLDQQFELI